MSDSVEQLGTIVDDTNGKPVVDANSDAIGGNQSRLFEPETIAGYDAEEPRTERIGGTGAGGSGDTGTRYTKSGRVDGRTLRGKRGRNTGTDTGASTEPLHLSKIKLEDAIYGLHAMASAFIEGAIDDKQRLLLLDKEESKQLGDALQDVGKFYNVAFDPKKVAIFQLCVVAGTIYGSRIFAYRNRLQIQKAQKLTQSRPAASATSATPRTNGAPQPVVTMPMAERSPSDLFGPQDNFL